MPGTTRGAAFLSGNRIDFKLLRYEHAVKGADYAAAALGIEPGRIAKTLVAEVDGAPVFVLVPAGCTLSLKALARAAGGKRADLVEPSRAERLTGYTVGGISPFGSRRAMPVYAERSYLEHDRVALNAGGRGVIVELARDDLQRLLEPVVDDLAVPVEP